MALAENCEMIFWFSKEASVPILSPVIVPHNSESATADPPFISKLVSLDHFEFHVPAHE